MKNIPQKHKDKNCLDVATDLEKLRIIRLYVAGAPIKSIIQICKVNHNIIERVVDEIRRNLGNNRNAIVGWIDKEKKRLQPFFDENIDGIIGEIAKHEDSEYRSRIGIKKEDLEIEKEDNALRQYERALECNGGSGRIVGPISRMKLWKALDKEDQECIQRAQARRIRKVESLLFRGLTVNEIAKAIGWPTSSVARDLKKITEKSVRCLYGKSRIIRKAKMIRLLEIIQQRLVPGALRGDLGVIESFRKLQQEQAKLEGFYAPEQKSVYNYHHIDVDAEMKRAKKLSEVRQKLLITQDSTNNDQPTSPSGEIVPEVPRESVQRWS